MARLSPYSVGSRLGSWTCNVVVDLWAKAHLRLLLLHTKRTIAATSFGGWNSMATCGDYDGAKEEKVMHSILAGSAFLRGCDEALAVTFMRSLSSLHFDCGHNRD
jgi:hypothetical protein